jgi:hypothetical protein
MKVVAPSGTSGTIAVPTFGKSIDIAVGGTKVWSHGVAVPGAGVTSATLDGDYVELSVGSGTFDISTGSPVTSDQTITFGAISNHIVTAADFHVTATATSGLTVTFAAAGACTVSSSGLVHLTKVGTCTVTASQPGNDQWAAAASVSRSFQVMAATPITRAKVTITGGVTVGSTLTAHTGSWGVTPVALAYAWRLDGKAIAHGTASTLKVVSAYKGHRISVSVTASAPARASVTVTSASVAIPKTLTSTPRPVIHGTASVGHVLSVSTGTWKPSGVHLTYHWYRNGVALKHSVGKTYRVVTADRGVKITVSVTGTKAGYLSVTKTSASKRIAR